MVLCCSAINTMLGVIMIRMDDENSLLKLWNGGVKPAYGGRCLSDIPASIAHILGVAGEGKGLDSSLLGGIDCSGVENVVLLLIDGLGYEMLLPSIGREGFFKKFADEGSISPITSVFPSTTAAGITSVSTGLTTQEHALPEWKVYFREIDMVIDTLPFASVEHKSLYEILGDGADPKMLYNGSTLSERLSDSGVEAFNVTWKNIQKSAYNSIIKRGSAGIPYTKNSDAAIILRRIIESRRGGRAYIDFYTDSVDSVTHTYGPGSEESAAEIADLSDILDRELLGKISREDAMKTLLVMTADHGHARIRPEKTVYLNDYPEIIGSFEIGLSGRPIPPTGSCRDVFLHIKREFLDRTIEMLTEEFGSFAKVVRTEDAIKEGLFGLNSPKKEFYDRVGNVMLLPDAERPIWYEFVQGKKMEDKGMHGGLSRQEMMIPFGMARLSDLL